MGLSLSDTYSLSDYVPFRYLKGSDVIDSPNVGILLEDSFESIWGSRKWLGLWMREKGKVKLGYDSGEVENSRCLLVKSDSKEDWSCSHNKFIEVKKGDIFSYEVSIKIRGEKISGYASVDAFDEKKKVIKWHYISVEVNKTDSWVRVGKEFTISDDITYIRFGLGGTGIGEYRFDDVCFRKE